MYIYEKYENRGQIDWLATKGVGPVHHGELITRLQQVCMSVCLSLSVSLSSLSLSLSLSLSVCE